MAEEMKSVWREKKSAGGTSVRKTRAEMSVRKYKRAFTPRKVKNELLGYIRER